MRALGFLGLWAALSVPASLIMGQLLRGSARWDAEESDAKPCETTSQSREVTRTPLEGGPVAAHLSPECRSERAV